MSNRHPAPAATARTVTVYVAESLVRVRTRQLRSKGVSWLNELFEPGAILPDTVPAEDLAKVVAAGLVRAVPVTLDPEGIQS